MTVALTARDLSCWSIRTGDWALEAGEFEVSVGASSRDLRLSTVVHVAAPPMRVRLDRMATLQEWLADPEGATAIPAEIGTDAEGAPAGILGSPKMMRVIGNFPISSLATFPGMGITRDAVQRHSTLQQPGADDHGFGRTSTISAPL